MSDNEQPEVSTDSEAKPQKAVLEIEEIAQIASKGNTLVIVLPLDKINNVVALGMLAVANDAVKMQYATMAKRKAETAIIAPVGPNIIKNKLAKIFK